MNQLSLLVCLAVIPAVVRADTVAFWRFSERPAGQAADAREPIRDASGFANHGRLFGPAKYVGGSGFDGSALEWDGSGLLEVPDAHVFDFRGDFTIEAMVRTKKHVSQYIFIRNGPGGEIWIRQHVKGGHDAAVAALVKSEKGVDFVASGPRALTDGHFHHVALVRRVKGAGGAGQLVLYVDGKPVASKQKPVNLGPMKIFSRTSIGGLRRSSSQRALEIKRGWIGAIDFVRVSDAALDVSRFLGPGGTTSEKILAANRAPAVLARIKAVRPKKQPPPVRPRFNMIPTGDLGNFPRDFQPHVQLFVPGDQLGAIDPSPYKNLFPDALIHDFDGDGHKDIWTEKRFYRNTGKYRNGVPVFARFQDKPPPVLGRCSGRWSIK